MSNIIKPSLIADEVIEIYRPLAGPAQRIGVLADAMRLLNFIDAFCISVVKASEETSFNDNDYQSSTIISNLTFNHELIKERGGFDYFFAMYKQLHDNVGDDEFSSTEEIIDYLNGSEYRCNFLEEYVDIEELSRAMRFLTEITGNDLREFVASVKECDLVRIASTLKEVA